MTSAAPPATREPVVRMRGITHYFGSLKALDSVDLDLLPGEIHAILGENGAGKSTLMSVLSGQLSPAAGRIEVDGSPVRFSHPTGAAQAGIGMVHQHFLLVPPFTVIENLALAAKPPADGGKIDPRKIAEQAARTAARLGWSIPLNRRAGDLAIGSQQRVEILKTLLADARILLLDEPTAVLAPQEVADLFRVLRALRDEGRSLAFVSHKLTEVLDLCDRVTVLRRGRVVGAVAASATNPEDLALRMVGVDTSPGGVPEAADAQAIPPRQLGKSAETVLAVANFCSPAAADAVALSDMTFEVRPGEILGFAGVDGNGQAELGDLLTGIRPWSAGSVAIGGKPVRRLRSTELAGLGIGYIPPDRRRQGLALTLSVRDNLCLEAAGLPEFGCGPFAWFLGRKRLREFADRLAADFDIRAESLDAPASSLSGGNQQKIVIARALWRSPRLLIAVSPTRGLDVAATAYVHAKLRGRRAAGGGVVLISTELDEVIALSDRIAVLYEGRLMAICPAGTPRETLGLLMGGKLVKEEAGNVGQPL